MAPSGLCSSPTSPTPPGERSPGDASAGLWALETTTEPDAESRPALVRQDGATWTELASTRDGAQLADRWPTPEGQLWGVGSSIVRLR